MVENTRERFVGFRFVEVRKNKRRFLWDRSWICCIVNRCFLSSLVEAGKESLVMFAPTRLCRFRVLLVNNSSRKSANLSPPSNNVPIKSRYSFSARNLFRKTDVVDKPGISHSVAPGYPQTFILVPFRFLHQIFIPMTKTSLTFGTILCIADVSQQYLMIKLLKLGEEMEPESGRTVAVEKKLDWMSARNCLLIGTLALGPLYHFWYR